jgi:hypothetical protein
MTDGKNDGIIDALSNPVAAGVVLPFPTKKGDDQRKW